ncbi:MAG: AMP-binding protein [Betaproteobacteria bacterium]|nr:AMP-binding protein [Betaproteobacteria bacterium]
MAASRQSVPENDQLLRSSSGRCYISPERSRDVISGIKRAEPLLLVGVPRFYERVYRQVLDTFDKAPLPIRLLGHWSLRVASQSQPPCFAGSSRFPRRIKLFFAELLVLRRVRRLFGRRIRYLMSGSAPLSQDVSRFFESIGLPIYEAYGVSECIVPIAMNVPFKRRAGSVGIPLPENHLVIKNDGEIHITGAGVFGGYVNAPPTACETLGENSRTWATGDLGYIRDGYLFLQGRKTENFKLSTGRWVSPRETEERLMGVQGIDLPVVVGSAKKAALAIFFASTLPADSAEREEYSRRLRVEVNERLCDLPEYQRVAGMILINRSPSVAEGEITTNLKLRRKAIESKYAQAMDDIYSMLDRMENRTGSQGPVVIFL